MTDPNKLRGLAEAIAAVSAYVEARGSMLGLDPDEVHTVMVDEHYRTLRLSDLRTILAAQQEGWVLVPREPTAAMLRAAEAKHPPAGKAGAIGLAVEMYRAMLAALPPPPAKESEA